MKKVAGCIEGSGGGKKEAAQAGGKNPEGVVTAFKTIEDILEKKAIRNYLPIQKGDVPETWANSSLRLAIEML